MARTTGSRNKAPRPDRKKSTEAYASRLTVKLTAHGRKALTAQRKSDAKNMDPKPAGDAEYVRALLTERRKGMKIKPAFVY